MVGKWKVQSNPVGGNMMYAVYRLRDVDAVDHSGNREYASGYIEDKDTALTIAEGLNRKTE
ncbi:hypothetical protein [Muricomes intestini]|jgi:hypothetical protein|uniref:Uncharacterized protein n=1 Tax=Muricomes intestini TaxID=1796634 RepID=A0A4R3K718_9FIRM|nr:hypothetical protein [Muricomes intestini]TCS78503.1 hypothetical protein EDD59_11128 [Muricomes intestini]HCR83893.1 hypothetical protein [Lachnospiraceae bacterium]